MIQNSIVGKQVRYSLTKDVTAVGTVLGVESIQASMNSDSVITGYLIVGENSMALKHIAYWRIIEIIDNNNHNNSNTHFNETKEKSLQQSNQFQQTTSTTQSDPFDDLPF